MTKTLRHVQKPSVRSLMMTDLIFYGVFWNFQSKLYCENLAKMPCCHYYSNPNYSIAKLEVGKVLEDNVNT